MKLPLRFKTELQVFTKLPDIVHILRDLRMGPGAVALPQQISRIECQFSPENENTRYFSK